VVVPLLALTIALIIRTASPRYTVMQQKIDQLNNGINETITNERVIKSFVREEFEKEKFAGINRELVDKSISALKMMILMQPVSTLAINITTLAVVWSAGKQMPHRKNLSRPQKLLLRMISSEAFRTVMKQNLDRAVSICPAVKNRESALQGHCSKSRAS
jgi:ABC-type multidrug transport system fused ATPase/permease subunit